MAIMSHIQEVYDFVLPELAANGFDDTVENRVYALQGLLDAWTEDPERSFAKQMYMHAVSFEINMLKCQLIISPVKKGE
jgi:hypothetical protein